MTQKILFWLLDATYDVVGNIPEIRLWGIDDKGRRVVLLERNFRPYFYVLPRTEEDLGRLVKKLKAYATGRARLVSIEVVDRKYYGKPVKAIKVTCSIPSEVPVLREIYAALPEVKEVLEADIRFYMRYMIDYQLKPCSWHKVEVKQLPNVKGWRIDAVYLMISKPKPIELNKLPDLKIMAFDIECYNPRGTPNPERDPVIIISIATNKGVKKLLKASNHDDRLLIREFVRFIKDFDPDIIVGYNSNRFDWPYLMKRAKRLGIRLDVTRAGGPPAQSVYGHISVAGRANVDLYDFAEEMPEVKVKTLENVADYLGVMPKSKRILIEGAEIYKYWDDEEKRKVLLEYAMQDAESTLGIAEKILPFAIQLSSLVGLTLDQVGAASVGFRVEWFLMREAYLMGELIPNRVERPPETYKGAIVLVPRKGLHENIAVLDFSSMYPSIMISKNISPDTYVPPSEVDDPRKYNIAPEVKHAFRKEPPGFYKRVLIKLIEFRRKVKEEMKKYPPGSIEYRILYERQRAIKVITNACYGYAGWTAARWYKREVAEATTAWGRKIIGDTINLARKLGLDVIYGDTDSIFVKYDKDKIEKLIREVKETMGLTIKPDKIYVRVFFTEAKKRYCGLLPDGRIDVVGLEAVRGDWSDLAKEVQEKVIEIILKEGTPQKAVEYVRKVIKELKNYRIPLKKLIIWKTLTKNISEYTLKPPHVTAAERLLKAGYKVSVGDKIGYVIVKRPGKLADKAMPYILVKDVKEIDVNYYIEKQILPVAERILKYFGVSRSEILSEGRQATLFDFM